MELWVFRHAESTANRDRRMAGRSADPLTPRGQAQAIALGQHLKALQLAGLAAPPTHCYCSPLLRARQTLAGIRQGMDPLTSTWEWPAEKVLSDLTEIEGGIFSGLTWAEAEARHPDLCARLAGAAQLIPIPGAEAPEAIAQRAERLHRWLLQSHGPGDRLWLMSHGGFLNYFLSRLLGCDRVWDCALGLSAYCQFQIDSEVWNSEVWNSEVWQHPGSEALNSSRWQIRRFNEMGHCLDLSLDLSLDPSPD